MSVKSLLCLLYVIPTYWVNFSCVKQKSISKENQFLTSKTDFETEILKNKESPYYIDFASYPKDLSGLPIGFFDSGTGGGTVIESVLRLDELDNETKKLKPGGDGRRDFEFDSITFLADVANMPYGAYPGEGKRAFLEELILKDAWFLLSDRFHLSSTDKNFSKGRLPVKAIVIACNTATAYGQSRLQSFIKNAGVNVPIVGVIDSGSKGALDAFAPGQDGIIVVIPTEGTVASGGYIEAIKRIASERNLSNSFEIVQQGAVGLAGAIDGSPSYIKHGATIPRAEYKGPAVDSIDPDLKIDQNLMNAYRFEESGIVRARFPGASNESIQLNSPANYVRFHLVTAIEKARKLGTNKKIKSIIMGCTHYPYEKATFLKVIEELRDYQDAAGRYIYRDLMAPKVTLVDPGETVSRELYQILAKQGTLAKKSGPPRTGNFFQSIPSVNDKDVKLDNGWFTYEYKYGRDEGFVQDDVRIVAMTNLTVSEETILRFKSLLPEMFSLFENNMKLEKDRNPVNP